MIKCIFLNYTTAVQRISCVSKFCIYNCNIFFYSKILIINDNKYNYDIRRQSYIYKKNMRFPKVYLCNNDKMLIYVKLDKF